MFLPELDAVLVEARKCPLESKTRRAMSVDRDVHFRRMPHTKWPLGIRKRDAGQGEDGMEGGREGRREDGAGSEPPGSGSP